MLCYTRAALGLGSLAACLTLTACNPSSVSGAISAAKSAAATPSSAASAVGSAAATAPAPAGSSGSSSSSTGSSGSSSSGSTGSACTAADLKASIEDPTDGQEHSFAVNLGNISSSTCTMYGFPGVDAVGYTPDDSSTKRDPIPRGTASEEHTVTLAPGQVAQFGIGYEPSTNSSFEFDPKSLIITPPGTYNQLTLPLSFNYKMTWAWENGSNQLSGETVGNMTEGPVDGGPGA